MLFFRVGVDVNVIAPVGVDVDVAVVVGVVCLVGGCIILSLAF